MMESKIDESQLRIAASNSISTLASGQLITQGPCMEDVRDLLTSQRKAIVKEVSRRHEVLVADLGRRMPHTGAPDGFVAPSSSEREGDSAKGNFLASLRKALQSECDALDRDLDRYQNDLLNKLKLWCKPSCSVSVPMPEKPKPAFIEKPPHQPAELQLPPGCVSEIVVPDSPKSPSIDKPPKSNGSTPKRVARSNTWHDASDKKEAVVESRLVVKHESSQRRVTTLGLALDINHIQKAADNDDFEKTKSIDTGSAKQGLNKLTERLSKVYGGQQIGILQKLGLNKETKISRDDSFWRWYCYIVTHPWFKGSFSALILANSFVMSLEGQYHGIQTGYIVSYPGATQPAAEAWPNAERVFYAVEYFFGIAFTIELGLRISVYQCKLFDYIWNWLDLAIVLSWMASVVFEAVGKDETDSSFFRAWYLTRCLRLLRLVNTIQSFDALYLMITSIKGSCIALFWSVVFLFLVQTLLALILMQTLEGFILDKFYPEEHRHEVYRLYGTFSKVSLTMFELSLGNWVPPGRILAEYVSEWYAPFVLIHKSILGFAVVKVIMGVFLQHTFKVAATDDFIMTKQKQRDEATHLKKMKALFEHADADGSGCLDLDEFREVIADPSVKVWLSAMNFQVRDADTMFHLMDDGDEELTAEELIKGVAYLKGPARGIDLAILIQESHKVFEIVSELEARLDDLLGNPHHELQLEHPMKLQLAEKASSNGSNSRQGSKESCGAGRAGSKETAGTLGSGSGGGSSSRQGSKDRRHSMALPFTLDSFLRATGPVEEEEDDGVWKKFLMKIVTSNWFEGLFAALIMGNTVVMGFEAQYRGIQVGYEINYPGSTITAKERWPGAKIAFAACEWTFGVCFAMELMLKLVALRGSFCRDPWNGLDAIIVLCWVITSAGDFFPVNPTVLRLFRLGRLMRLMRLVKKIHSFDALYLMITSLKGSITALGWSVAFLTLIQLLCALVLTHALEGFMRNEFNPVDERIIVYRYFGTFSKTFFTLFEITLGTTWTPPNRVLTEIVNEWYVIFTLSYLCIVTFAIVMVITTVFLQDTFKVAETDNFIMMKHQERDNEVHTKKMRVLFAYADADGSGGLDKEEFVKICDNHVIASWLASMGIDVQDASALYSLLDDGDECLDAETLVDGAGKLKGTARNLDLVMFIRNARNHAQVVSRVREKLAQVEGCFPQTTDQTTDGVPD